LGKKLTDKIRSSLNFFNKNIKYMEEQEIQNESVENQETVGTEQETIEAPQEEVVLSVEESLELQLKEQKDKYLRLYSEFENFRKRTAKERIDLIVTANESLLLSVLPVLDDFERAQKSMETATDIVAVQEGVQLIREKFIKILVSKGLEEIPALEQAFDTELHEAITQIPAPTEDLKGKVVDCVEKGYKLGDKVIRYSKVVIGA
jgi:molecular chaperone GrpE